VTGFPNVIVLNEYPHRAIAEIFSSPHRVEQNIVASTSATPDGRPCRASRVTTQLDIYHLGVKRKPPKPLTIQVFRWSGSGSESESDPISSASYTVKCKKSANGNLH